MNYKYVKDYYGVPAETGRIVIFRGRRGVIAEDRGNYIGVNFDEDKPGVVFNVHPTDGVEYQGIDNVRKMTRSQERYRNFIKSEYPGTFAEYLGIKEVNP